MPDYFVPLSQIFPPDLLPLDQFVPEEGVALFDRVGVSDYRVERLAAGVRFAATLAIDPEADQDAVISIGLPPFPGLALVLHELGEVEALLQADFSLRLALGKLALRLPAELLRPVRPVAGGAWESDPDRDFLQIVVDYSPFAAELAAAARDHPIVLTIDAAGRLDLEYPFQSSDGATIVPRIALDGPAMIGQSGVVIEAEGISFSFDPHDPVLVFGRAALRLPTAVGEAAVLPALLLEDASFSRRGFSGTISAAWDLAYQNSRFVYQADGQPIRAELFGLNGGLRRISLALEDNRLTQAEIGGGLRIPYFDAPVDVRLGFGANGDFSVALQGQHQQGITLKKEELLALTLRALAIARDGDQTTVVMSGGLQPLLLGGDGLQWPTLDVQDLYIDSAGRFRIAAAWLDLQQMATLDLWGFKLELARLGIGMDDPRQRMWLDLAGSLRLMDQLPVGLGIEGFKLSWPQDIAQLQHDHPDPLDFALELSKKVEVDFKGVELFYGVPKAVEFTGLIKFFKDAQIVGFSGDMALRVPASGFGAQAGLLIGFNQETPPYPFLYLYFGVDLPAGIPLGQSGLALKAAQGMFGINVVPDKTAEQNWYYDWYKRRPEGAYPTTKWMPGRDALALGVGVTITTADGYVKGTRGLLVLSLPGPVLMIEGRALLLNGLSPDSEPPLKALAVFDGNEATVQFNIEADAELVKDVVEAYAMAEAFFDFNNVTRWHLYLGQDQPEDRLIRADILKFGNAFLFKADSYFMLDMVGAETLRSRMGVFVGFKPAIPDIGPVKVELDATLDGKGEVTIRPEQFSGEIDLDGTVGLSVFDLGIQLSAKSDLTTEGPLPFDVMADIDVHADLPWPLDPVEVKVHFEWSLPEPPKIDAPLSLVTLGSRFSSTWVGLAATGTDEKTRLYKDDSINERKERAKASPIVDMDSEVILEFTHEMNSKYFARHPDGEEKHFDAGYIRFVPTLTSVQLFECRKNENGTVPDTDSAWSLIAETGNLDRQLPGVWTAGSGPRRPEAPSARRLQLWTDNPLLHTDVAPGLAVATFLGSVPEGKPLAGRILDDYPDLMRPLPKAPPPTCMTFERWSGQTKNAGETIKARGATLSVKNGSVSFPNLENQCQSGEPSTLLDKLRSRLFGRSKKGTCLVPTEDLEIRFPEPVREVKIHICRPRKTPSAQSDVAARTGLDKPVEVTEYLQKNGEAETGEAWKAFLDQVREIKRNPRTSVDVDLDEIWHQLARQARSVIGEVEEGLACAKDVSVEMTGNACKWLIRCKSDDDAFSCLTLGGLKGIAISQLCWITKSDEDRAALSDKQAETNSASAIGELQHSFQPNCFYRLVVATEVTRSITAPTGSALKTLYDAVSAMLDAALGLEESATRFKQTAYFQTTLPPTDLRPYVKTVAPEPGFLRHFLSEEVSIRFLRPHVSTMFTNLSQDKDGLRLAARDPSGNILFCDECKWRKAQEATLFPEEQVWRDYRNNTLGWNSATSPAADDVLTGNFSGANKLATNMRYELLLVKEGTETIRENTSYYFQSRFTTSDFDKFQDLTGNREEADLAPEILSFDTAFPINIGQFVSTSQSYAAASQALVDAQLQHRFDRLAEGRAGLEKARLHLRKTRATLEDEFRFIAMTISPSRLFTKPTSKLSLALIRSTQANGVVGIWVKAPESLDIQIGSAADQTVGRTAWALWKDGAPINQSELDSLFDWGNRHLIILMRTRPMSSGLHLLKLTRQTEAAEQELDLTFIIA